METRGLLTAGFIILMIHLRKQEKLALENDKSGLRFSSIKVC